MTPEGKVKKKVTDLLDKYCAYYFKPATGGYGRSGIPDIVGCIEGKFFAVECKAGDNTPTRLQIEEIDQIRLHKGIAFTVNEKTISLLEQWLVEQSATNSQYFPTERVMTVPASRFKQKRVRLPNDYND